MSAKLAGKRKRGAGAALVAARPYKQMRVRGPQYRAAAGELKFLDVATDDAVVAAGATIQNAGTQNLIVQGITENQRIGRKCTIRSIHWKYRVDLPEVGPVASPNTIDEVRVILYWDKQANKLTAAGTDVLETATPRSFRNLANAGRFVILLDKLHTLNWTTLASDAAGAYRQAEVVREFSFNKQCNIPIEFSGADGTMDEITSNNIGVLLIGTNGAAGFLSTMRLRFSDN